jgi:lactate permease
MIFLTLFLRVWKPAEIWTSAAGKFKGGSTEDIASEVHNYSRKEVIRAWMPWLILSVLVFIWGIPEWKKLLDGISIFKYEWPGLHMVVQRMPPVVA